MARTKAVTPEALAALGAEALAEVLVAHAATDPTLRKKLGMRLAGTEGPGKLAAEIEKRINTIGRSRSFVDWEKRKPLVHELDHLRVTIATRLARQDAPRAIELLWDFIGITDAVMQRVGDGIGEVEDVFGAGMEDLARLSAAQPPGDGEALARRVLAFCGCADPAYVRGVGCERTRGDSPRYRGRTENRPTIVRPAGLARG